MENKEILKKFENEIELGKESASYLFYGDKRVDLLSYALEFSKIVMTKDVADPIKAEKERVMINKLQHPDVEVINQHNENIKIDEIREIIYSSVESTFNSRKKIFILCGIENLRKESSNALLKTLEEPPKDVYFILLSKSLNIIPTIKSRVIKFHLKSPTIKELGVNREVYYFFDGNERFIKNFKKNGIPLEKYENRIETLDDVLYYFVEMKNYLSFVKVKNDMKENLDKKSLNLRKRKINEKENEVKDYFDFEKDQENNEKILNLIVGFNKSVDFFCKKIYSFETEEIYSFVNEIIEEFRDEKEILLDLLSKIAIGLKNFLNAEELKMLVNLKNSVRNNVNIRSILFNFFNICAGN